LEAVNRPRADVVIRPSAVAFVKRSAVSLVAVAPLIALQAMVYAHQQGLVHALVATIAVFATLALVAGVYFLNVRVSITDTEATGGALDVADHWRGRHGPIRAAEGQL